MGYAKKRMSEHGASAKISRHRGTDQIAGEPLIGSGGESQSRNPERREAAAIYVGGDAEIASEIECALSFPSTESVAGISPVGIAPEECDAGYVLAQWCSGSRVLGHKT